MGLKKHKRLHYMQFAVTYNILVLIPLAIICFSIMLMLNGQLEEKITDSMQELGRKEADFWSQQMKVVNSYMVDCRSSKIYNPGYSKGAPGYYVDIIEDLKKKEANFPFIEKICLYSRDNGWVLTSAGLYEESLFFTRICRVDSDIATGSRNREMMACMGESDSGDELLVLIYPLLVWGEDEMSETQYLMYLVSGQKLMDQFNMEILSEEGITRFTFQNELLYEMSAYSEGKKPSARFFTYSEELGYGFSITHMVSQNIVFKNMLPYLQGYGAWILCSVTVGFCLAIWFSKRRYHIFQNLVEDNEELEGERNVLRRERCLYELLTREMEEGDELWERCLKNNILVTRRYKLFIVIASKAVSKGLGIEELIEKQMGASSITTAYPMELFQDLRVYFICSDENRRSLEKRLEGYGGEKNGIGVGSVCMNISGIRKSYRDARIALLKEKDADRYPFIEVKALRDAVEESDSLKTQLLLDVLFDTLSNMGETMSICLMWDILQITGGEESIVLEKGEEGREEQRKHFEESVRKSLDIKFLEEKRFKNRPIQTEDNYYRKKNIVDLMTYIHGHFLEENFSIKYMAAEFETSASNLSHFFKKNKGISISRYVEQVKMERAKELLDESDMTVSDIAHLLQYGCSSVFIEVFKKQEGMTPGAYRNRIRDI